MQQSNQAAGWGGAERKRTAAVVQTLATSPGNGESLAEVAHDARNMVTALGLYCDLLEEPGVLATPFAHYGNELRLVAAASRRLVEKLAALDIEDHPEAGRPLPSIGTHDLGKRTVQAESDARPSATRRWDLLPALPIENLAGELLANRNLLAALAGPTIALSADTDGCALPVRLTGEDLTRVLVNLVKNSAEAMPAGGKIHLRLRERPVETGSPRLLTLTIDDTGSGIHANTLDRIFEAGFSTQTATVSEAGWPSARRGLGLSITRSILEAAGGRIRAENRSPSGARLEIDLPVRTR
jgi:signal transduction histidine kinase